MGLIHRIGRVKGNQDIAQTILKQLGGNKFIVMTGSYNFLNTGKGLSMHLRKNKIGAQYLQIVLGDNDLYTMTFSKTKKVMDPRYGIKVDSLVILKETKNVYADMLQDIFTSTTGLRTSLGTMGG